MFNRVILVGRLVADPEVRYTPDGIPIAIFRIAVNRPVRRGAEQQVDYFRIVTFRRLAEFAQSYLTKGRLILVEGKLRTRSYNDAMGQRRTTTEIWADAVQFMERRPDTVPPVAPSVASNFPVPLEDEVLPEQDMPVDDAVLEDLPPFLEEEEGEHPF